MLEQESMSYVPRARTEGRPCVGLLFGGVLLLATALLAVGCGHPGGDLAVGSYERGLAEFEGNHLLEAIEDLKLFIRRNPGQELADDAQYLIGKAYMDLDDLPLAAVEFEILRADYPTSELVDDAFYLEGLCYVQQVPDYRLDQTITRKAVDHLRRYLNQFPQGKQREAAQAEMERLTEHLDRKRLEAARLYYSRQQYAAAEQSLQNLLEERTDSRLRPQMLYLRARVHRKQGEYDQARDVLQELLLRFAQHELADDARTLLQRLEEEAVGEAAEPEA